MQDYQGHIKKLRERLTAIDRRIESRDVFWKQYDAGYRQQARILTAQVMKSFRPEGMDQDQWNGYRQTVVNAVTSKRIGFDYMIYLDIAGDLGSDDGYVEVTRQDLRAWVEAGLRREEGGKRITPDDELLLSYQGGMKDLLFRLALAYYGNRGKPNYERLRDAIQDWVKKEKGGADTTTESFLRTGKIPPDMGAAIREAWNQYFGLVVPVDFRHWALKPFRK